MGQEYGNRENRNYKIDNGKAVLIFLVVLGHLLELRPNGKESFLYLAIYSFHMPAFVFFSGYFAKWDPKRLIFRILCPYICFQFLYLGFAEGVLGESFSHPFTRPYWLMWYLASMACWTLLLPLADRYIRYKGLTVLLLAGPAALSLLIGFVPEIGYRFGLSRTIVLFPFFLTGYLCRGRKLKYTKKFPSLIFPAALAGLLVLWGSRARLNPDWLYHSLSYPKAGYTFWIRGLLLLNAGVWTAGLLLLLPGRKLPFLSVLGENTMAVYLLHGFFIKAAKADGLLSCSQLKGRLPGFFMTFILLLISALLCFLLGNPWTKRFLHPLFHWEWLDRLFG